MKYLSTNLLATAAFENAASYSPSSGASEGNYPVTNMQNDHTGIAHIPSPQVDAPATVKVRIETSESTATTDVTWTWVRKLSDPVLASSANLNAFQVAARVAHADLAAFTATRDSATGAVTLSLNSSPHTMSLIWTHDADTTATGDALGFDTSSDDTGADSYTGDEIRYDWVCLGVFDMGSATSLKVLALIAHTLKVTDIVEWYGHTSDLGGNRSDWNGTATAVDNFTVNNEFQGCGVITLEPSSAASFRYHAVFVKGVASRTEDDLRIGAIIGAAEWVDWSQDSSAYPNTGEAVEFRSITVDPTPINRRQAVVQAISMNFQVDLLDWSETNWRTLWNDIVQLQRVTNNVWCLDENFTDGNLKPTLGTYARAVADGEATVRTGDLTTRPLLLVGAPRGY